MARGVALLAAAVSVVAFFLPWMQGDGAFVLRTFSGFDFARLIRNFEITTSTQQGAAQVRGTAVAFYLAPALLVNASVVYACAPLLAASRRITGLALAFSAGYTLLLITLLGALSVAPGSPLAPHVGWPREGMALTAAAALTAAWLARRELRRT